MKSIYKLLLMSLVVAATACYNDFDAPEMDKPLTAADMEAMAEKTLHSTTVHAARTALNAGVGRLIVGHYSSRFPSVDFYLEEMKEIFPDVCLAHDGDVVEIDF